MSSSNNKAKVPDSGFASGVGSSLSVASTNADVDDWDTSVGY